MKIKRLFIFAKLIIYKPYKASIINALSSIDNFKLMVHYELFIFLGGDFMGRNSMDEELESQLGLIIGMIKDRCTDKEIIEKLGISASTWKRKKAQNKIIKEAIDELIDARNQQVEEALFKVCTGYSYYEEVVTKVKEEVLADYGQTLLTKEDVKISKVKKYRGPDVVAQKYWLNNKKKAVWKDDPHKVDNDKKLTKLKEKEFDNKVKMNEQFEEDE
jgi:hypothetical protein